MKEELEKEKKNRLEGQSDNDNKWEDHKEIHQQQERKVLQLEKKLKKIRIESSTLQG
jgi:hypothetical protein